MAAPSHSVDCGLPRVHISQLPTAPPDAALIVTGVVDRWPAFTRWAALFDSAGASGATPYDSNCTLGARSFAAHVARAKSPMTAHYRAVVKDFDAACPQLRQDYAVPPELRDGWEALPCASRPAFPRSGSRDWRWMLLGGAASGTPWHVDAFNTSAWSALVVGAKLWAIYPPGAPRPPSVARIKYRTQYGADAPLRWFSSVLPSLPPHERPQLCVQRPGEIVLTPGGWWHAVLNLTPHVAVSFNRVPPAQPAAEREVLAELAASLPPPRLERLRSEVADLGGGSAGGAGGGGGGSGSGGGASSAKPQPQPQPHCEAAPPMVGSDGPATVAATAAAADVPAGAPPVSAAAGAPPVSAAATARPLRPVVPSTAAASQALVETSPVMPSSSPVTAAPAPQAAHNVAGSGEAGASGGGGAGGGGGGGDSRSPGGGAGAPWACPGGPCVAVVTGGTGGIGGAILAGLADAGVPHLVSTCRPGDAGAKRCAELRGTFAKLHPRTRLQLEEVDLSSTAEVAALCAKLDSLPVRVLINNAAAAPHARSLAADGVETVWAVNVLAYFQLMTCLREPLRRNAPSRVVNVVSDLSGGLDLADVTFERRQYDPVEAYSASKEAEVMLTWEAADRYRYDRIACNAAHPGALPSTRLVREALGSFASMVGEADTPAQCAATEVLLATHPQLANVTGTYWRYNRPVVPRMHDEPTPRLQLWALCERMLREREGAPAAAASDSDAPLSRILT